MTLLSAFVTFVSEFSQASRSSSTSSGRWRGPVGVVLAASVVATVPMLIIFFIGQRYFVEGIATTGRKAVTTLARYQNDRSLPVSWLTRKLRKKNPK